MTVRTIILVALAVGLNAGAFIGIAAAESPSPDPILAALAEVDAAEIDALNTQLSAFGNRYTGTQSNNDAAAWLKAEFEAAGLTAYYDPFSNSQNIVGVKAPAVRTSDAYIVVGAHMDGVSAATGGASEDNGSGTSALVMLARAFEQFDVDVEIRFIAFSGEEIGLVGSSHYASNARANGDEITAMFNADMISYSLSGARMKLLKNTASQSLVEHVQATHAEYGDVAGIDELVLGNGAANSDHYPFWSNGYPAVFFHSYHFTPYYHAAGDTPNTLNFTYGEATTRLLAASVGSLAGLKYRGDAHFTDFRVLNPDAREGDVVTTRAVLANPGPGPLPQVPVALYADGVEVDRKTVLLAPGASVTVDLTWDSSGSVRDHALTAIIDPDGTVAETDETNNVATTSITIDAPDLVAHAPQDAEWEPVGFSVYRVTFTASVENVRGRDAAPFTVGFYHTAVAPENRFASVPVDGLAAGASADVTATWERSRPGDRDIIVVADDGGVVAEWDDANNGDAANFPLFMGIPWKFESPNPFVTPELRDEDGDGVPEAYLWWEEYWLNGSGVGTQRRDEGEWRRTG